jgi:hypothetical protein
MVAGEEGVGGRVVVDYVHDDAQAEAMRLFHEQAQAFLAAEEGIDGAIVGYGVGTAQAALSPELADRMDGSQVDIVEAEGGGLA